MSGRHIVHRYEFDAPCVHGFGDFCRGVLSFLVLQPYCNYQYNIHFKDHPFSKCFREEGLILPADTQFDGYATKFMSKGITARDFDDLEYDQLKREFVEPTEYKYLVYSNSWLFPQDILAAQAHRLQRVFVPTDYFRSHIDEVEKRFGSKDQDFLVLHYRMGDPYHFKPKADPSKAPFGDDETGTRVTITEAVARVEAAAAMLPNPNNLPIMLITDNPAINPECHRLGLITFDDFPIAHTHSKQDVPIDHYLNSMAQFFIMGKAKGIKQMAVSGFSFWCAQIFEVRIL